MAELVDPRAAAARAWRHGTHAAVCDVVTRWRGGSVVRATHYPNYWSYNLVRVERDSPINAAQLIAFADRALAGLAHRRIDLEQSSHMAELRAAFASAGWRTTRLVWMRHERAPRLRATRGAVEVAYDAVAELRLAWHFEDFAVGGTEYLDNEREIAQRSDARVFAVVDRGRPLGFAQLERRGGGAEVSQAYVLPEHRGSGIGTAVTLAAIEAGAGARELWVVADDEDRPKQLYERLGFRAAWTVTELLLAPVEG